mgnify:CR=1 FL=1
MLRQFKAESPLTPEQAFELVVDKRSMKEESLLPGNSPTSFELTFDEKWDSSVMAVDYQDIEVEFELVSRYERRKLQ